MKTTYLVYKQVNGVRQLVVATPAEWDYIPEQAEKKRQGKCRKDGEEGDG